MQASTFFVCTPDGNVERSSLGTTLPETDKCRIHDACSRSVNQIELSIGAARIVLLEPDRMLVIVSRPATGLTSRQRQVAEFAAAGATIDEIARGLAISPYTVRQHLKVVYRVLDVANRVELAHALGTTFA